MNCRVTAGAEIKDEYDIPQEFDLSDSQCALLKPGAFIGQGAYASAYEVEGNPTRVVKFTADPLDAKASLRVQQSKPKGAVRVSRVATLRRQKTYGPDPIRVYDPATNDFVEKPGPQPIFAIVAERLHPLEFQQKQKIEALKAEYHSHRDWLGRQNPATFKVPVNFRAGAMKTCTTKLMYDPPECSIVIDEAIEAIEDVAHKTGIIPLDIHKGNWGLRANGDLALLDLGVSSGAGEEVPDTLDGADETALNATVIVGIGIALWLALRR